MPKAVIEPRFELSLAEVKDLFVRAGLAWSDDRVPRLSAAFSFYAILSLSPLLVLGVTVLGFMINGAEHHILEEANGFVGPQGVEFLKVLINNAHSKSAGLIATVSSLCVTFFSASNLFLQLQDATNAIWKIKLNGPLIHNLIRTRVLAFLGVLSFGLLVVSWVLLDTRLTWISRHSYGIHLWPYVSFVASTIILAVGVAFSFKMLPNRQLLWTDVWPAAFVTALGFAASRFLLNEYFSLAHVSAAYGIAGAMVVVLLWLYYSAQIYFFGVELTYVYAHSHGSKSKSDNAR